MLIEADRIFAVGRNLKADGAQVIDTSGMVVMPGLVNSHIHTWEISLLYLVRLADKLEVDILRAAARKMQLNAEKYSADKARGNTRKYTQL